MLGAELFRSRIFGEKMKKVNLLFTIILLSLPMLMHAAGCMEATSDEGVNVVGYLQSQFGYKFNEDEDKYSFSFSRARLGILGNIPYDFSYYIMCEFTPHKVGTPYFLDGFITYSRLAPFAEITMGQFKPPFSLELNTPCQSLHTMGRSKVLSQLINPQRDLGILIEGNFKEFVKYAFSFTNASEFNKIDDNTNKAITGRIVLSPLSFLNFGGSYQTYIVPPNDSLMVEGKRMRYAAEVELDLDPLLIQGEYIVAEDMDSYTIGCG